ncbi:hypothetical protein DFJ77DRAFT_481254 [Powellomyces hirtus]|nr:hypothetical protein DFJ77DRAFT_481254 [Powellomyces hirtus]
MLGSNNRSKKRQQQETGSVVSKECSGDVEEMKKRFQKQNHDIVKVNARFATKIRELENQRVDLAAKFFSLEARILHLESENKLMKEHRRDLERLSSGMMQMNANKSLETAVETINSFMESMSATAAALERMVLPALNDGMRFVSLCDMVFNSSPDMSPVECYPEKSANPLSPPLGPRVTPRNDDVDRLTPISEETDANMISETLQESRSSPGNYFTFLISLLHASESSESAGETIKVEKLWKPCGTHEA